MSKAMPKERVSTAGGEKTRQTKGSDGKDKKRRKHFFKRVDKKPKEVKNNVPLPPKDALEFSANWKALLGTLSTEDTTRTKQKREEEEEVVNSKAKPQAAAITARQGKGSHQAQRRAKGNVKIALPGVEGERLAEARTQQKRDGPRRPEEPRVEKRKSEEGDGRTEKRMNKNERVEEEKKLTETDIWFDDVDPDDIEATLGVEAADIVRKKNGATKTSVERALTKEHAFDGLTRAIAIDCEMVGVGLGGEESMLARVSIVNQFGKCVYDKYVRPTERVTDYRTAVSGIRPADIKNGENFKIVQQEVAQIIEGRILVGHAIHNDLKILFLDHPKRNIRDTQKYKPFKKTAKSGRPALRVLCREVLNVKVQQGEHSSVQDAQATMRLYTLVKKQWEAELKVNRGQRKDPKSPRKPRSKPDLKTPQTKSSHDQ